MSNRIQPGMYVATLREREFTPKQRRVIPSTGLRLVDIEMKIEINVKETIRMRLQHSGWKEGRGGHLYMSADSTMPELRAVFRERTITIDYLGSKLDKRNRRSRLRLAGCFYKQVVFTDYTGIVIGSTFL